MKHLKRNIIFAVLGMVFAGVFLNEKAWADDVQKQLTIGDYSFTVTCREDASDKKQPFYAQITTARSTAGGVKHNLERQYVAEYGFTNDSNEAKKSDKCPVLLEHFENGVKYGKKEYYDKIQGKSGVACQSLNGTNKYTIMASGSRIFDSNDFIFDSQNECRDALEIIKSENTMGDSVTGGYNSSSGTGGGTTANNKPQYNVADNGASILSGCWEKAKNENNNNGEGIACVLELVVDIFSAGVGILGVLGIMIAGIQYLTAGGDVAQVTKAKRRLFEIAIGLVAYVLVYVLLKWLVPNFG